ncbi:MAG: LptE family protein [Nitrospinae bacterium]|nr:LptE family protein [Nitrospinota bacterium]
MRRSKYNTVGGALCVLALALVAGCGYALVGKGSALPQDVRSVSIPLFENKTGEPELDSIVTRAVKDEFIRDGRLKVDDSGAADTLLVGSIESYSLQPVAYSSDNVATEYIVSLDIQITHRYARREKTLTKQRVAITWRYVSQSAIAAAESQRLAATEDAAKRAAETLVSVVVEAF